MQSISWLYDIKINESSRNPWSDSRYKVFLVNTFCCLKLFDAKKRSKEQKERGSNLLSKVLAEKVTKNYSSIIYTIINGLYLSTFFLFSSFAFCLNLIYTSDAIMKEIITKMCIAYNNDIVLQANPKAIVKFSNPGGL